ncbi:hypothetical protein Goari_006962 [Gossypium aridum]|uniref:CLAVATA3/ESR (CLE)-related protein 45 n=3 Tax=Gossypium TaxID=3633 RepID=A0A7J8XPI0_GOSAI|nr:hypothetical protein [Gossypium aridum]
MMWQESKEETRLVGPSFGRQNTVANDRVNIDGSPCLGSRILSEIVEFSSVLSSEKKMVCSAQRVIILVILLGLLALQPVEVSGLRNIDFVFRRSQRVLKAVDTKGMSTEKKTAFVNNKFDPNRSSKRRVRRGSDPIHNRS